MHRGTYAAPGASERRRRKNRSSLALRECWRSKAVDPQFERPFEAGERRVQGTRHQGVEVADGRGGQHPRWDRRCYVPHQRRSGPAEAIIHRMPRFLCRICRYAMPMGPRSERALRISASHSRTPAAVAHRLRGVRAPTCRRRIAERSPAGCDTDAASDHPRHVDSSPGYESLRDIGR